MYNEREKQKKVLRSLVSKYGLNSAELRNMVAEISQELESKNAASRTIIPTTSSPIAAGWFAFEGGKFSPDPNAYWNCQGVVGWVNPNPNAPVGERGLFVTPDSRTYCWGAHGCRNAFDLEDGKGNTIKIYHRDIKHHLGPSRGDFAPFTGCRVDAAAWCYRYINNYVKYKSGFLPAINQLRRIVANSIMVNPSLKQIGGDLLKGMIWSSTEKDYGYAMYIDADTGKIGRCDKEDCLNVRCVIPF